MITEEQFETHLGDLLEVEQLAALPANVKPAVKNAMKKAATKAFDRGKAVAAAGAPAATAVLTRTGRVMAAKLTKVAPDTAIQINSGNLIAQELHYYGRNRIVSLENFDLVDVNYDMNPGLTNLDKGRVQAKRPSFVDAVSIRYGFRATYPDTPSSFEEGVQAYLFPALTGSYSGSAAATALYQDVDSTGFTGGLLAKIPTSILNCEIEFLAGDTVFFRTLVGHFFHSHDGDSESFGNRMKLQNPVMIRENQTIQVRIKGKNQQLPGNVLVNGIPLNPESAGFELMTNAEHYLEWNLHGQFLTDRGNLG